MFKTHFRSLPNPKNCFLKLLCAIYFLFIFPHPSTQEKDTTYLKALYDRCLDFSEEQLDSLYYYSEYISSEAKQLEFVKGDVLSLRLKGVYYDLKGEYEKAIDYYLQSLTAAQKIKRTEYEIAALSDLAILYSHIKQPRMAKQMYLQSALLSVKRGDNSSLVTTYGNLGAIYNQLNMPDSALFFLQEGLLVGKPLEGTLDMSVLYNNIGNVYFSKKQYTTAQSYFNINKARHEKDSSLASLWLDYLNIADVFIEMKRYDSAHWYAGRALEMAGQLGSKSKQSDSYSLLAKLHARKGEYKGAYEAQRAWYRLDTSLVNEETNSLIASLQEKYNSQKRQRENDRLLLEVDKQRVYKKLSLYMAAAAAVIALVIGLFFLQKRATNKKLRSVNQHIIRQNEKLKELNFEKNSLISIVSHDLSTPFASIKIWGQLLSAGNGSLNDEQRKAISRIMDSTAKGEELIKNILDVEKAEVNQKPVYLEEINLAGLVHSVTEDFEPVARKKEIVLSTEFPEQLPSLITDRQLVSRICQNLISNAIKFTPPGKTVRIRIEEEETVLRILIADEGVGIKPEEMPMLFSKYSKISSLPTGGEISNGLGLSIVKRIVQELNGTIHCESEPGKGSLFTVIFKK